MGESKRRKLKDPTFGTTPRKKSNGTQKPRSIRFFKFNDRLYANNHNALPGEPLVKPIHQCNQYQTTKPLMDAAVLDLRSRADGVWIFNPTIGWKRVDLSVPEIFEIAKFDETAHSLINLGTPIAPIT